MSKINELFNVENYNLIQDDNYYYLFRALNNGDHADMENGITTDENGKVVRVRTDRARYVENFENRTPKYEEDAPLSLLQVIDHIKEHHRYDTNCISLSSNANVSIMYGNGYYSDEYTLIRVPKKEIGEKVINAGEYMLEEMNKRIDAAILKVSTPISNSGDNQSSDNQNTIEIMNKIDEAENRSQLLEVIASSYKLGDVESKKYTGEKDEAKRKKPLRTRISEYSTLTEEQNLLKNKIIAKLTILEERHLMEPIMPHTRVDSRAIATLGLAFSSRELIHYGEIGNENLFEVSKEYIHMLGLLQQTAEKQPELIDKVEKMENQIIDNIIEGSKIPEQENQNENIAEPIKISVKQAYQLTDGRINYKDTQETVDKVFYLSKSVLNARQYSNLISTITGENPEYADVIESISDLGIDIEPKLMDKKSNSVYKVSESVSIGLSRI